MTAFVFDDEALHKAMSGHEVEILAGVGIEWASGSKQHIECPYPDHDDENPSWRWDEKEARAFCTCSKGVKIIGVVMKKEGLDYPSAKLRIAEILRRDDLIATTGKHDVHWHLNPPAGTRDDQLPKAYLAYRLGVAPEAVLMPTTRMAGWRALSYYEGGRKNRIGDYPCVVFEIVNPAGHSHGTRVYVADHGRGKAELPSRKNGARRDVKKALLKEGVDLPGHSVLWGDPTKAHTIIVGEGVETCQALAQAHEADIRTGTVAVAAAISESWMRSWQPWPATERVIIVADRDEGEDPDDKRYGIGQDAAETLAKKLVAAGKRVALAVPGEPGTDCDALDVWVANGASAVQALVAGAMPASECRSAEPPSGDASEPPAGGTRGLVLPHGFSLNRHGLWYQPPKRDDDSEPEPEKISGPFHILARTSGDDHHNHGLLLHWTDHDGEQHRWSMPRRLVHADGNAIAAALEDAGLSCGTSRSAHERLKHFFGAVRIKRRVRCVDRAGWHGLAYVLPNGRAFGTDEMEMQSEHAVSVETYAARGTLVEWKQQVAQYAIGNDRLTLSISAAFAPPLLEIANAPSGGVHYHGQSQIGKTTLQQCAASVWGPGELGMQVRSWRATANGLEGTAAERCDGLLPLDETNQVEPNDVIAVVYMLANQQGKVRANRSGVAIPPVMWRLLFISSGEKTIAATLAEVRKRLPAGAEVRLLNVPADAGAGMGVWQQLHGQPNGAALTDHLRAATVKYCGTAGPAFLQELVKLRQNDGHRLVEKLRGSIDGFLKDVLPADADGQVRSAAVRFGLIAVAGELATSFGILPWQPGEARAAVAVNFKLWTAGRGGTEAAEDIAALSGLRSLLSAHGSSRFAPAQKPSPDKWGNEPELPRIANQLGYVSKMGDDVKEYWILASLWPEVCGSLGLEPGKVAAVLRRKGYLLGATDKQPAGLQRAWGNPNPIRVYRVSSAILAD